MAVNLLGKFQTREFSYWKGLTKDNHLGAIFSRAPQKATNLMVQLLAYQRGKTLDTLLNKFPTREFENDEEYTWDVIGSSKRNIPLIEARDENGTVVEDNGKVSFVSQKFATHDQAAIEALALEKNLGTFRMKYVIEQRRMTVRQLLQELGTEAMRDGLHTNVWVNALFADFKFAKMSQYNPSHWLITDMRFPNELEAIKERGGITIRVTRDYALRGGPEDPKNLHPSETALDKETFDYEIVNDGTIEELVGKVRDILIKEEIIRDGNI